MSGDPLDAIDTAGQAVRAARVAARQTPTAQAKRQCGRSQKRRGYACEVKFVKLLGPQWERMPLSGALGGKYAGDVRYVGDNPAPAVRVGEIKRRAGQFVQFARWLAQGGGVDFVGVDPAGGVRPFVVVDAAVWVRVLEAANNA